MWQIVLSGHVEAEETFIGGKTRNMYVGARKQSIIRNRD